MTAKRNGVAFEALLAAYREGLALAAVAVIVGAGGVRIVAVGHDGDGMPENPATIAARWWCRGAAQAESVAGAAMARLRRRRRADACDDLSLARACVAHAAQRLGVALQADAELAAAAAQALARLDTELENQQQAGGLKAVNASYRTYRLEATARGERVLPCAQWMSRYRANLLREMARHLR